MNNGSLDENVVAILYKSIYDGKGAKEAQDDVDKTDDKIGGLGKRMTTAFSGVQWGALGMAIKKATSKIGELTKKSADYIETLNMFQVAFNGNTESIRKFADTLSDTLNLDDSTIISAAAHFKILSQSMGLANETGEKLSKLMTQMTLDISSLYNMDFDKAQRALQYAMEGRGTSLKQRTGVSVLESSVQTTLDAIGVDAYVKDMNDAEKAIARVITMEYQLMSSQGDLARTIEAPANQMRVMGEQLQMLARNIGNVFLPVVAKILPYLNAFLIVLNAIISALARLVGYREDMFDTFEEDDGAIEYFDGVGSAIDGVGKSADSTAKKLQGLRGFDKLNVIKTPTDTGGGGGGAGGGAGGGISPGLLDAFNKMADKYKTRLDEIETKATKIANKILTWLGFIKKDGKWVFEKVKPGTILASIITIAGLGLKIKQVYTFLSKIGLIKGTGLKTLANLATLFKNGTIAKNMGTFAKSIESVASIFGMSSAGFAAAVAAFVAIGAAVVHAYNHIDEFKKKIDGAFSSVAELGKTIIQPFVDATGALAPILEALVQHVVFAFEQAWEAVKTILGFMYDGVVGSFSAIADTINGVAKIINDLIHLDIGKAFEDLKTMVKNIKEDWNTYWASITKRFDEWKDDLKNKIETEWVPKIKEKLEELPKKIEEFPGRAAEEIGKAWGKMLKAAKEADWASIGNYIVEHIILGVLQFNLNTMKMIYYDIPIKLISVIGDALGKMDWGQVGKNILDGIINGMFNIPAVKIANWASRMIKGIKEGLGIASPSKEVIKAKIGDYVVEGITVGMDKQLGLVEEEAMNIVDSLQNGLEKATANAQINADINPVDSYLNSEAGRSLLSSIGSNMASNGGILSAMSNQGKTSVNPTIILQVGNKEIAKQVITDLQDMAKDNGKPITIGG